MEASKRSYAEQQKATAPPKNTYVASNGKSVKIDLKDKSVEAIRSKPTSYHQPEIRRNRVETHVHHYHYPHNYDYYYQRPYYHVGGGYSSAFWWMMMDWSVERRATWLYHNRDNIERSAYEEGLRDGKVKAQLEALEKQNIARDENYVDTEFKENPSDMYDASYIEATYNPTITETPVVASKPMTPEEQAAVASVFKWIIISMVGIAALGGLVWFVTCVRFGK